MQCIYLLVAKALASPSLCAEYRAAADAQDAQYSISLSSAPAVGTGRGVPRGGAGMGSLNSRGFASPSSACPSSVEMLQQPLFDMLRIVFSKGDSIMQSCSLTLAVEIWMLYVQPWRAQVTLLSGTHRGGDKYSDQWLPYVAANLHFYTTLFVSFIKCTSRLDFRTTDDSGMTYYNLLESVLTLFTDKGLRQAIDRLVSRLIDKYPHSRNGGSPKSALKAHLIRGSASTDPVAGEASLMGIMINQHHVLFPDRSVDLLVNSGIVDVRSYDTLRAAIIRLVQAHYLPAKKQQTGSSGSAPGNVFAAIKSVVVLVAEGMAGHAPSATHGPTVSQFESTIQKLCDLATLGPLADVASKNAISSSVSSAPSSSSGERDLLTGKLTPLGKARILSGKSVSRLEDYLQRAQRDILDAPLRSDEMPDFASFMIYMSKHLNDRFDLPVDKASKYKTNLQIMKEFVAASPATYKSLVTINFRFNLRPFARVPVAILTFAVLLFQLLPTFSVDILDFIVLLVSGMIPAIDDKTVPRPAKAFTLLFAALRLFCRVQGVGIVSFLFLFSIAAIAMEFA